MVITIPPDLEELVQKRLSTGAYESASDVVRHALEAQDAVESFDEEERQALSQHIEDRFLAAERGELIDGDQAERERQAKKMIWLEQRNAR